MPVSTTAQPEPPVMVWARPKEGDWRRFYPHDSRVPGGRDFRPVLRQQQQSDGHSSENNNPGSHGQVLLFGCAEAHDAELFQFGPKIESSIYG